MRMAWTHRSPLLLICGIALVSFGGCLTGGDDTPDDPALVAAQNELAEGLAENAINATIGALEGMVEWSQGIQPSRAADIVYHDEDQAWTITDTDSYEDPEVNGSLSITWWVQFRTDGVPQQQPNDFTDEIEIRLVADNEGNYHPGDFTVDFDLHATYEMTATRHADNSASVIGAGTLDGESTLVLNGGVHHREHHITWSHDLTAAPDEACVSGTLAGSWDGYTFDAVFNGAGGVAYSVSSGGDEIATGTREYDCDPAPL